jgi:hypothetical protein
MPDNESGRQGLGFILDSRLLPAKKEAMTECGGLWKKRPSLHLQDLRGTARMPALQQKPVVSRLREAAHFREAVLLGTEGFLEELELRK